MTRRQWVSIDTLILSKGLPRRLWAAFGAFGVLVWIGFLAAAKRSALEGSIEYASPQDAFALMGIPPERVPDDFDLDEFWRLTGAKKETRVKRRAGVTRVAATRWGEWQQSRGTRSTDASKTSSTRSGERSDTTESAGDTQEKSAPDMTRHDQDQDKTSSAETAQKSPIPRPVFSAMKNALAAECYPDPSVLTKGEWGRVQRAAKEIIDAGGTPEDVADRARVYRRKYPDIDMTPTALSNNWSSLDPSMQRRGEGRDPVSGKVVNVPS